MPASFSTDSFTPDRLIAGDAALVSEKVTVADSAALTRGAVLGKITASGKYLLCAKGAADGSQTALAILAEDCDASAADAPALIYERGIFNANACSFGAATVAADVAPALRDAGIYLITPATA